ncbi:hypothetical protein VUJ46_03765 [Chryseobacterium sp. MYb264]|uniref:hypothetical protein n=1 Tax=Chryseobacterium sp. MYb264 TaxID=2745153 RepID=UPI002E113C18|nr:hypothetical protein VUJ46_03765 [Chryseobacterium sp. MYb264]
MKKILFTSALFLLIVSCGESSPENNPLVENAVDNTDSSLKGSFESDRYDDNMIDKIYSELIKNDKKLSALDDRLEKTYKHSIKVIDQYGKVLNKSEAFYRDANFSAESIHDSILKHKLKSEVKASTEKYQEKTKNVRSLISQLNENTENMTDLYKAFKIRKTLPEIGKYQNAHPLKMDSLEHFISKQNQLLNELKNLK